MAWTAISTRNETPPIVRGGWLDALRFIVAALIILHHFQGAGPIALAEGLHPVFERGGFLLTNFFLIDSGYVLKRGLEDGREQFDLLLHCILIITSVIPPGTPLQRRLPC